MYQASEERVKKAVYRGFRHDAEAAQVCKVTGETAYDWENLKPTNENEPFDWGYGGTGPDLLARAILTDFYNERVAADRHEDFKWKVVAKLPHREWVLTAEDIESATKLAKEKV